MIYVLAATMCMVLWLYLRWKGTCPGLYWDWKQKVGKCYRTDSVAVLPETESRYPENTSANYQHNILAKNSWISISSTMLEKPCNKMYVIATKFTMFLLLLLISHIISLLWTDEPGGEGNKKEVNLCWRLQWSRGSVLPLSTQVCRVQTWPKTVRIFQGEKILSTPSFGREVKPWVPRRRFAACKRSLNWRGNRNFKQNYRPILAHTVPPFATRISRVVGDVGVPGGERGNLQTGGGVGWVQ